MSSRIGPSNFIKLEHFMTEFKQSQNIVIFEHFQENLLSNWRHRPSSLSTIFLLNKQTIQLIFFAIQVQFQQIKIRAQKPH